MNRKILKFLVKSNLLQIGVVNFLIFIEFTGNYSVLYKEIYFEININS